MPADAPSTPPEAQVPNPGRRDLLKKAVTVAKYASAGFVGSAIDLPIGMAARQATQNFDRATEANLLRRNEIPTKVQDKLDAMQKGIDLIVKAGPMKNIKALFGSAIYDEGKFNELVQELDGGNMLDISITYDNELKPERTENLAPKDIDTGRMPDVALVFRKYGDTFYPTSFTLSPNTEGLIRRVDEPLVNPGPLSDAEYEQVATDIESYGPKLVNEWFNNPPESFDRLYDPNQPVSNTFTAVKTKDMAVMNGSVKNPTPQIDEINYNFFAHGKNRLLASFAWNLKSLNADPGNPPLQYQKGG